MVHLLKMCLLDCHSLKAGELRDIQYSDICYVVRLIYAIKLGRIFKKTVFFFAFGVFSGTAQTT
jgi:hypothetical protein